MPEATTIQRMFAEVAPGYDRANRALSFGVDRWWRRRAVRMVGLRPGERGLDVCCGTGDLAFALQAAGAAVTGTDFCAPMLAIAGQKARRRNERGGGPARLVAADALALPFADHCFDFATVAFGIRNLSDPVAGLREMARVVRPGGRIVVLEFCRPRLPVLGALYRFYFGRVLPRLGGWISGARNGAYRYLHDSVMAFPERGDFLALMQRAGLQRPRLCLLTGGIAALYRGEVEA
ncbi:MAG: bifunctional demethylmenaquinone methyltransferase/2-methoxy-6-polyprenyl-1,4-benzoquinol methylase UbiE [Planctomycetes bacterium]|nr:bifunctional demethylmenaquinone methyltransferase/2-methoxy-6-polyprenyl-1,4-benzoquinol methylase UbiE [Planctomycetota bacterium]